MNFVYPKILIITVPSNYAKGKVATFIRHGRLHPPRPYPFFLASFWFYPQIFISLGQNYNHV